MDGQKDNDVTSTAYRCLLLWPISIVSVVVNTSSQGWTLTLSKVVRTVVYI